MNLIQLGAGWGGRTMGVQQLSPRAGHCSGSLIDVPPQLWKNPCPLLLGHTKTDFMYSQSPL